MVHDALLRAFFFAKFPCWRIKGDEREYLNEAIKKHHFVENTLDIGG